MTARERVIMCRLIQKIDRQHCYARQIGISSSIEIKNLSKNDKYIRKESKK